MSEKEANIRQWFAKLKGKPPMIGPRLPPGGLPKPFARPGGIKGFLDDFGRMVDTVESGSQSINKKVIGDIAETIGERAGRASVRQVVKEINPMIDDFIQQVDGRIKPSVDAAMQGASQSMRDSAARLIQEISTGAILGGLSGAATAPEGDRKRGVIRGAMGGVLGGAIGAGWSAPASKAVQHQRMSTVRKGFRKVIPDKMLSQMQKHPELAAGAMGSILGGTLGGYTTRTTRPRGRGKKKESSMEGHKYAGFIDEFQSIMMQRAS